MCCAPGRVSAITRAPATCMRAPARWSNATVGYFRATSTRCARCPASATTRRRRLAAIAFDTPAVPVDGNVERVVSRLVRGRRGVAGGQAEDQAIGGVVIAERSAPAISRKRCMDLGATICSPKRPACALCPWNEFASRACCAAIRRTFPRKAPKREGKLRRGAAFVALRADGRVLLRKRPDKGLLASMTEVPGSDWAHDFDDEIALRRRAAPERRKMAARAGRRHVMCSRIFRLSLTVFLATVPRPTKAPTDARWAPLESSCRRSLAQRHA